MIDDRCLSCSNAGSTGETRLADGGERCPSVAAQVVGDPFFEGRNRDLGYHPSRVCFICFGIMPLLC